MMSKPILTAVNYLNTKPLLYGLTKTGLADQLDIRLAIPSECARQLQTRAADIVLTPVAVLANFTDYTIITDYCIGCDGAVKTVCIYAEVPLQEVTHLYLDYHSRTSVALTQVLLAKYWQLQPALLPTSPTQPFKIEGTTAALVIGDKAIGLEEHYPYVYDLGAVWKAFTGLPFVFAAWVATRPIDNHWASALNAAFAEGIASLGELLPTLVSPHPHFSLQTYYEKNISYQLDAPKREALAQYLHYLTTKKVVYAGS